ncbi:MAG: aspartate-semialdehyde dehydrogenase [Defluviitaleaceae bacterium]|nr:aspartate-semialdehyde dehydrogenase [Defluviitaleaceae bacterium]
MKKFDIAVVGVTGMVGRTIIQVLEEKKFQLPINNFYPMASAKSAGSTVMFNGKDYKVEELNDESFDKHIDIALFSAGGGTSMKFAPVASSKGCIVIDNSSAWRMDYKVPLVVPEVNPGAIKRNKGIIANPNCSTIQAVVVLKPLHDKYKIKRVVYSTYQAVSGAGLGGVNDLKEGTSRTFRYPIAGNCIPQIDAFVENGYTKEEMKMINETRKILDAPNMRITATTVRVPVVTGHSESINIEFENNFELEDVISTIKNTNGVVVQNGSKSFEYPMPLFCEGKNEVFVGRIRRDESVENGLNLWVVADNVRKGAATNAVQIAELLMERMK